MFVLLSTVHSRQKRKHTSYLEKSGNEDEHEQVCLHHHHQQYDVIRIQLSTVDHLGNISLYVKISLGHE
jgi:hypothetical protein